MKTLSQTPNNTRWRHYPQTNVIDMPSRIQRRINQLEREERESLANYEDCRYQQPEPLLHPSPGRQWPWALLVIGIVGFILYALMTTPDWF